MVGSDIGIDLGTASILVYIKGKGSLAVLVQRVKEVATYAPVSGQVVFEYRQPVTCSF